MSEVTTHLLWFITDECDAGRAAQEKPFAAS